MLLGRVSSVLVKHLEAARWSEPALWAAGRWVCLPEEGRLLATSCRLLWAAGSTSLCRHPRGAGARPRVAEGSRQWVGAVWARQSCCLPAPCGAGRTGQRIFLACCPARAQRFPARPDPSFCRAVGSSAKPRGISLELSKGGPGKWERFPCRSAAGAVLMSLFRF